MQAEGFKPGQLVSVMLKKVCRCCQNETVYRCHAVVRGYYRGHRKRMLKVLFNSGPFGGQSRGVDPATVALRDVELQEAARVL